MFGGKYGFQKLTSERTNIPSFLEFYAYKEEQLYILFLRVSRPLMNFAAGLTYSPLSFLQVHCSLYETYPAASFLFGGCSFIV